MLPDRLRQLKADLLKALGQPTRLKILELLYDGERCVCEIFPAIQEEQSNVSRHLGFLRSQGIVTAERRGTRVFYRLADRRIVKLLDDAEECLQTTGGARQGLRG
jgi:DNA-binding transcriptional ArsR family regulator